MKNDQYFPYPACMMADDRVIALTERMGMEGFGLYIALLGELRQRDEYRCATTSLPALARRWNIGVDKIIIIIREFDLFIIYEDGTFSSVFLNETMLPLEEKRLAQAAAGKQRAITAERLPNGTFASFRQVPPASKEEESKEELKKRREKEEEILRPAQNDKGAEEPSFCHPERSSCHPERSEGSQTNRQVSNWEARVDAAFSDRSWLDVVAMHSGLGLLFMERLEEIKDFFKRHVRTYGKEDSVLSLADAKSYFGNFIRPGSPTQQSLLAALTKQSAQQAADNPYRYEEIDPQTGARMYCGQPLPKDAPPRPSENAVWSEELREWS